MKIRKLSPTKLRAFLKPLNKSEFTAAVRYDEGTYVIKTNVKHRYLFISLDSIDSKLPTGLAIDKTFTPILLQSSFKKQVIAVRLKTKK